MHFDIALSEPRKNTETLDGGVESTVTLTVHSARIQDFIDFCQNNSTLSQIIREPAKVIKEYIKEYKDYNELISFTPEYSGYDLTNIPGYSGFSGVIPRKKEAGLGAAHEYAAKLREQAATIVI